MPDRLSKSQIDKVGARLSESEQVSEADLAHLQEIRAEYDNAMSTVADRLAGELGLEPGSRLKTVGTIIDKLRREHIRLSQMQDIAGVRVVRTMGLGEQEATAEAIVELFDGAKVVDRRERPSHGYRAIHVIVSLDARNVEIQVRTEPQHLWAQVFERFADRYGRGVRYGLPSDEPDAMVPGFGKASAFVETWQRVARLVRNSEVVNDALPTLARPEELEVTARQLHEETVELMRDALAQLSMGESSS